MWADGGGLKPRSMQYIQHNVRVIRTGGREATYKLIFIWIHSCCYCCTYSLTEQTKNRRAWIVVKCGIVFFKSSMGLSFKDFVTTIYQLLRTVNVHMISPFSSKLILQIMFFFSNNLTWERRVTFNWRELLNDICFPSSVPEIWHVRIMNKTRHGENKTKSINNIFVFELGGLCVRGKW